MQLKEVLETMGGPGRLMIRPQKANKILYAGYKALLDFDSTMIRQAGITPDAEVIHIGLHQELTVKEKGLGLAEPINPGSEADYHYKDLEERIYFAITIDPKIEAVSSIK